MYAGQLMFEKYLTEAGMEDVQVKKSFSGHMKNDYLSNPRAIFDESIRNSDSNFSLYNEAETASALNNLKDILDVYGDEYFKELIIKEKMLYGISNEISAIKK